MSAYETSLADLFKSQAVLDSAKVAYQGFCDRVALGAKSSEFADIRTCNAYVAAQSATQAAYLAFRATALLTTGGA